MFEEIKAKCSGLEQPPSSTPPEKAEVLRNKFPGIPEDYLSFLLEVGWGDLKWFRLYSGPIQPKSVYGDLAENMEGLILIGDDFQGYCFGFDVEDGYQMVEI